MKNSWLGILALVVFAGLLVFLTSRAKPTEPIPADVSVEEEDTSNYTDSELSYKLTIPDGFKVERQTKNSILILPDVEVTGQGPTNFIYISVVTPDLKSSNTGEVYNYNPKDFEKFQNANTEGETVNLAEDIPSLSEWSKYSLATKEIIDNAEFKNFENTKPWEFPAGTSENRFIYDSGEKIYILGYYTGGDIPEESRINPRAAYGILKSFRFE